MSGKLHRRAWLALGVGMTFPLLSNLGYFVVADSPILAQIGYFVSKAILLGWPLACFFLILPREKGETRPGPENKQIGWSVMVGVVIGTIIVGAIVGLMQTPLGEIVREGSDAVKDRVRQLGI